MSNRQYVGIRHAENTISIKTSLTAYIHKKKPGMYVSYCPALDLYSQGKTEKKAEANIIEATELFIESCVRRGTLNEVLQDCGFRSISEQPRKRKTVCKPPSIPAHRRIRIPTELPVLVA